MSEEGSGGYTMAYCHECQGLVSLAGDGFIHLDGTPLCKGGAMTEGNPFDAARVAYEAGYQRGMYASAEGQYVTYADHTDALSACEQRSKLIGYALGQADMRKYLLADDTHSFSYGRRDALAEAVQRVEALPWSSETWSAHTERAAIIATIKGDQP
jgi:hypothetical protein